MTDLYETDPLTMEDVWGTFDMEKMERTSKGMIVARGLPSGTTPVEGDWPTVCPIWGDVLPYKSVTVICQVGREDEVIHWLSYVHGGDCVSNRKVLPDGTVAFRSDYRCW